VSANKLLGQAGGEAEGSESSLGQLIEQDGLEVPVWSSRSSQEKTAVHRAPWLGAETCIFCGVVLGCRRKPRASKKQSEADFG